MRAVVGVWRWRRSPLRRRTDAVEAWLALAALALMVFAAPAVGILCGSLTDTSLRRAVAEQLRHRHVTAAVVVHPAGRRAPLAEPDGTIARVSRGRVVANWTAYDGSRHSGTLASPEQAPGPGSTFPLWTDDHGRPVPRPMGPSAARTHAVFAGICAAAASAALIEAVRRLIVWRLIRRRYERLDRAWARYGPDWGRTGAGS
ncbi:hypothetical protein [Streptomyces sp. NBC_00083]|uniref:Rv1733c family protein n=1 Tax=Streptomyces sp. NBC_00083 TaxID=2975647 RepID=UPI00224FF9BB|nr:hypothetical protein [Streptomyces sp. NBC_00083]MCX5383911.1 hypothetical protein [Streptomyces sp. NBC_00083]